MGIIVIEGCDCAGKGTLAEQLARKTGYEIVKGSSFEIAQLGTDGMFKYMMDLLKRDNIIIDRFYLSNYVYGNLYNYPTMSNWQFATLAEATDERALTIIVEALSQTIKDRMKKRGDEDIKVEEIDSILAKYNEALTDSNLEAPIIKPRMSIRYDSSLDYENELFATMIAEMMKLQETKMYIRGTK
jgi:thymidylate kinase